MPSLRTISHHDHAAYEGRCRRPAALARSIERNLPIDRWCRARLPLEWSLCQMENHGGGGGPEASVRRGFPRLRGTWGRCGHAASAVDRQPRRGSRATPASGQQRLIRGTSQPGSHQILSAAPQSLQPPDPHVDHSAGRFHCGAAPRGLPGGAGGAALPAVLRGHLCLCGTPVRGWPPSHPSPCGSASPRTPAMATAPAPVIHTPRRPHHRHYHPPQRASTTCLSVAPFLTISRHDSRSSAPVLRPQIRHFCRPDHLPISGTFPGQGISPSPAPVPPVLPENPSDQKSLTIQHSRVTLTKVFSFVWGKRSSRCSTL
jgi:hypothetical protein